MGNATVQIDDDFIRRIDSYHSDAVIGRYSKDFGVSEAQATSAFTAFKQFMVACGTKPGIKVGSEPIDNMWHTFLLHSREYDQFCSDHFGFFIHHDPSPELDHSEHYFSTREYVEGIFGELDERFWPIHAPAGLRCISGHYCRTKCTNR